MHGAAGILAVVALVASACTPAVSIEPARATAGGVAAVEAIGGYPHFVLRALFWWQGLGDALPIESGISLYRVEYWTPTESGVLGRASGLLALPRSDAPLRGVVGWQHGTASLRTAAPSTPDPNNGVVAAAVFAGHGYALVAPDYLGFGASTEPHPYYDAALTASAVVDMLRASKTVVGSANRAWPDALFLAGFSQGGHATLAAQRALEAAPIEGLAVRASAPVAGPFDLAGIGFPAALTGRSPFASLYIAWIATTYARRSGRPLDSALRAPFAERAPVLFDGAHDGATIVAALPRDPRDMLSEELLAAVDAGQPHWFLAELAAQSLLDWTPRAPIRLYYGDGDVDVSPVEARALAVRMQARGADVTAISVGALDHEATILAAAPELRAWFDALAAEPR